MSADQTEYDVFISYARKDNCPIPESLSDGWVSAIRDHILADHRRFSTAPLRIFLDTGEIRDMDDWRHRILGALRHSKLLLVCLSPSYLASNPCRWEWEEYTRRQVHKLVGSDSIASVYFVNVTADREQASVERLDDLMRGNYTDLRPWFPEGAVALQQREARLRMEGLSVSIWQRLERARRAMAVPGNLRWQNPHFVGRRVELLRLHEQLGTGAVGVVTAVHGLGGQGKTELAVAYAHGFADNYPVGLWSLPAEGKTELLPLIGELAWEPALGFTPTEIQRNDLALLGRAVLEHLKTRAAGIEADTCDRAAACLLLLDNVSDSALLSPPQLATLPGGMGSCWLRIVATTRLDVRAEKHRLALLPVDALDEESALALIREHQPQRDPDGCIVVDSDQGLPRFADAAAEEAARSIVQALGGFTLAVEQVALYLGLHPEVIPGDFLARLEAQGLPAADTIPATDRDVAAQMLTQSKQLGLILDATIGSLEATARTALLLAAHLPPDCVPWPWLRELTEEVHPELKERNALGADPWETVRRCLIGLRLLTSGDLPEVARIHRLVAAHLPGWAGGAQDEEASFVRKWVERRTEYIARSYDPPLPWEFDALIVAVRYYLVKCPSRDLAASAVNLSGKVKDYRGLAAATTLLNHCHGIAVSLAASEPDNLERKRDLSVSMERLGDLAVSRGDLPSAITFFTDSHAIAESLVAADPNDAAWQSDLSSSHIKLGDLALRQEDIRGALRHFMQSHPIRVHLAKAYPANVDWQYRLSISYLKLGNCSLALEECPVASQHFAEALAIVKRLANDEPANISFQRATVVLLIKLGEVALQNREISRAIHCYSDAADIAERLAVGDSDNADSNRQFAVSLNRLGDCFTMTGDFTSAKQRFAEALSITERLASDDPNDAQNQHDLFVSHYKLAQCAEAEGDETTMKREMRTFFGILDTMKQRDMHLDPIMEKIHSELSKKFSPRASKA
jgi:tetratricopeptide (TPR) repeat protein